MKTVILIEDGAVQLVITPESDFEKNAVKSFYSKPTSTKIFNGAFYSCAGGWTRQSRSYGAIGNDAEPVSLILRIENDSEPA